MYDPFDSLAFGADSVTMTQFEITMQLQNADLRTSEQSYKDAREAHRQTDRAYGCSLSELLRISHDRRIDRVNKEIAGAPHAGGADLDLLKVFEQRRVPPPVITETYYAAPPRK